MILSVVLYGCKTYTGPKAVARCEEIFLFGPKIDEVKDG